MRLNDKARTLWADQICIDQDNAVEKSQQISLMDIIYRNARHVLVWLGQDQQRIATDAFALVNTLGTVFSDERQRQDFDRCHSDRVPQINVSQYSWSSLRALTRLPWVSGHPKELFRRIRWRYKITVPLTGSFSHSLPEYG
jgi:hypothetical protein